MTVDDPEPAFDTRVFGTEMTDADIRGFYDQQLQQLGWQSDRLAGVRSTVEIAAWGWCKDARVFRVGIEDQSRAFTADFFRGQVFHTVFEVDVQTRDRALGCPERPVH